MSDNGKSLDTLPLKKVQAIRCLGEIFQVIRANSDAHFVRFHVVSAENVIVEKPFVFSISPENTWDWDNEDLGIVKIENPELALVHDTRP